MDRICPLLSLVGDRRTVVLGADPAHRCGAERDPAPVDRDVQARLCLSDAHPRCERYRAHVARQGDPTRGRRALEPGYVPTRLHLVPERSWRAIASRTRGAPVGRWAVTAAAAAVLVAATGAVAAGVIVPTATTPVGTPVLAVLSGSSRPAASPTIVFATLAPTPSPDPRSSDPRTTPAVASATAVPSPAPTTAPGTPPRTVASATYVVAAGDSLSDIAARFGVSPEALAAANGIEDPDLISVGQVLVIPGG
jgi:LysM repeat protein